MSEQKKQTEQAEGAQGEREACAECGGSGKVYDVSSDGPWSCYACADTPEVVGYANADELDGMLKDRGATISPNKNGYFSVPLYRAPVAQAGQVPEEWRNAMERLERACDKRAELTSSEAYSLASQATGMRDALLELDNARLAARQLLAGAPAQGGE